MHDHEIKITLVDANEHEQQFEFEEPQLCIVGRAHDCDIPTPDGDENLVVSRHHCLLEIDPPSVRVHDLGSTNGTFVNGVKIPRGRMTREKRSGIRLHDGDEVVLGPVRLRVHVPMEERNQNDEFSLDFDELIFGQPNGAVTDRTVVGRKPRQSPNEGRIFEADRQPENARN